VRERLVRLARLGVTLALAAFVAASVATAPPAAEDRAQQIGSLNRCPVCAGEAIANSPTQLAQDMMGLVRRGVDDGLTDAQIIDSVVGAYGADAQVLDPPLTAETVALWLVPALVLAGGVGLVTARRRARPGRADESVPPAATAQDGA
jgi:cytochrome c-type biogenesis protein CcmH